jgi:hypothetical protein
MKHGNTLFVRPYIESSSRTGFGFGEYVGLEDVLMKKRLSF